MNATLSREYFTDLLCWLIERSTR